LQALGHDSSCTDARLAGARVARPRNSFALVRKHHAFIIFGISAAQRRPISVALIFDFRGLAPRYSGCFPRKRR